MIGPTGSPASAGEATNAARAPPRPGPHAAVAADGSVVGQRAASDLRAGELRLESVAPALGAAGFYLFGMTIFWLSAWRVKRILREVAAR